MNRKSKRLSGPINLRIILFAAIVLLLAGWPVYSFVSESIGGGIHDRGSYKEVDLRAMGFFTLDPHEGAIGDVPPRYRALDGQKVLLTGLVFPQNQAGPQVDEFTLQYSTMSCCIGGSQPLVQEKVFATAGPGRKLRYTKDGYYQVFGTLHVTMKHDGFSGDLSEVYHLDADSIEPL